MITSYSLTWNLGGELAKFWSYCQVDVIFGHVSSSCLQTWCTWRLFDPLFNSFVKGYFKLWLILELSREICYDIWQYFISAKPRYCNCKATIFLITITLRIYYEKYTNYHHNNSWCEKETLSKKITLMFQIIFFKI